MKKQKIEIPILKKKNYHLLFFKFSLNQTHDF